MLRVLEDVVKPCDSLRIVVSSDPSGYCLRMLDIGNNATPTELTGMGLRSYLLRELNQGLAFHACSGVSVRVNGLIRSI